MGHFFSFQIIIVDQKKTISMVILDFYSANCSWQVEFIKELIKELI